MKRLRMMVDLGSFCSRLVTVYWGVALLIAGHDGQLRIAHFACGGVNTWA